MKNLICLLGLSFALNSFSQQTLISHQCSGLEDGQVFQVNVHIDERIFCSDTLEESYVGALVFDKQYSLQELVLGKIIIDHVTRDMRFEAKEILDENQELEIMSLSGLVSGKYELNILKNDDPIEYDTIQLTCSPINYQMDC